MSQLADLSKPFPEKFIRSNPSGGGSYVKHGVYTQRLLLQTGGFDFTLVEIVRGPVAEVPPNPNGNSARAKTGSPALANAIVGAVCRLTVEVDGNTRIIEEVGDCEQPHNWPHDGARLKDATSDALKRCCSRIGLGLHLWCPDEYVLHDALVKQEQPVEDGSPSPDPA